MPAQPVPSGHRLTLVRLRDLRERIMPPRVIEALTVSRHRENMHLPSITQDRLRELENNPRHEPYYDEALALSRILMLPGIVPLITPGSLYEMVDVFGPLLEGDMEHFRNGVRLPLRIACRITVALGLDDPIELESLAIHRQIWSVIEGNERLAAPGECPWCREVVRSPDGKPLAHLPTCIADVVWASRSKAPYLTANVPRPMTPRSRGDSRLARGLKAVRLSKGVLAKRLAADLGMTPNYVSRLECLRDPLTNENADRIAELLGCSREDLFK